MAVTRRFTRFRKLLLAVVTCTATAVPVSAQQDPANSPKQTVDPVKPRFKASWEDHPQIEWPGMLRVEFRARLHLDERTSQAAIAHDDESFDMPRRRVGVEGLVGAHLEFKIEGEIDRTDPWRDLFVNYRRFRFAEVQAGQFKLPFGLEETTGTDKLDLVYRSIVSNRLAPGRDVGVMVHGRTARRRVGYELGVFANDGDNARSKNTSRITGGRTVAGRVTVAPFARSKSAASDLELGVAFTRSELPEGFPGVRGKSVLGVHFFEADQWVNGRRERDGVQMRWRPGRLAIAAEYMRLIDDRNGEGMRGEDLVPLVATGWYMSGAWVVAGASSYKRLGDPRRPLFRGGFGSVEVAARIERLSFGSPLGPDAPSLSPRAATILGNAETAETLGATWRFNRWVAVEGDVIHEQIGTEAGDRLPPLRVWSGVVSFRLGL